jgi:hypothetical protein
VWTVTTTYGVQAAINGASPGDVIVLPNAGGFPDYAPFTLNKSVTIRGSIGTRVGGTPGIDPPVIVNVPAGQVAHVMGIDFSYSYAPAGHIVGCNVDVQGGTVRFEQCVFRGNSLGPALRVSSANVVVADSTIGYAAGRGEGIIATNSHVTLRDCIVEGPNAFIYPQTTIVWPAARALTVTTCSLHAERVTFTGGSHTLSPPGAGATAVDLTATTAWLSDCQVIGGNSNLGNGATGLVNNGGPTVELCNPTLVGGQPGGALSSGAVNSAAPLVRLAISQPWQRGVVSTLTCSGDPNAFFLIMIAPDVSPSPAPGIAYEPVWCHGGACLAGGQLDALGVATVSVLVPNVPLLLNQTVWCQAGSGTSLPWHASTIAGGIIR